jgi:hypothetical protein
MKRPSIPLLAILAAVGGGVWLLLLIWESNKAPR